MYLVLLCTTCYFALPRGTHTKTTMYTVFLGQDNRHQRSVFLLHIALCTTRILDATSNSSFLFKITSVSTDTDDESMGGFDTLCTSSSCSFLLRNPLMTQRSNKIKNFTQHNYRSPPTVPHYAKPKPTLHSRTALSTRSHKICSELYSGRSSWLKQVCALGNRSDAPPTR